MIIFIDGPTAVGKSTLASDLNRRTGWPVYSVDGVYLTLAEMLISNTEEPHIEKVREFCKSFVLGETKISSDRNNTVNMLAAQLPFFPDVKQETDALFERIVISNLNEEKHIISDGSNGFVTDNPEALYIFMDSDMETRIRHHQGNSRYIDRIRNEAYSEAADFIREKEDILKENSPWYFTAHKDAVAVNMTGMPFFYSIDIAISAVTNRLEELSSIKDMINNASTIFPKAYQNNDKPKSDTGNSPTCNCG